MKCSICGKEIEKSDEKVVCWDKSNSAVPVNDGRCCDNCNINVVIPRRLWDLCGRVTNVKL